jgi:hypothetical protein
MDALVAQGARAAHAWASGTWTVPSVVSILTGASVPEHGWNEPSARMGSYPALPDLTRLPEVLQDAGFTTHGLYSNPYLAEELGFSRGFDTWKKTSDKMILKHFRKVVADEWTQTGRHFAYLHILGPHSPVDPSLEAQQRRAMDPSMLDAKGQIGIGRAKRNREPGIREAYTEGYLATVEDTDRLVGNLIDTLAEHRDETVIVVTSDHGELLGEHNIVGHGTWVWRELVEVPLILDAPGTGEQLPDALGIHAIPDLITQHLGIPAQWPQAFAEGQLLVSQREEFLAWSANGQLKAIQTPKGLSFYDLAADPGETQPVDPSPSLRDMLASWTEEHPALGAGSAGHIQLPESTQSELESLGYMEP